MSSGKRQSCRRVLVALLVVLGLQLPAASLPVEAAAIRASFHQTPNPMA